MSFTEKRLCNPTQLTTSGQILYTVPASKTSIIKQIVVTNVTGSAATFSLYIGSAATPNALFNATSVAANDTIIINLSQVLNQLETLTALASTNLALNITISGVENDGPLNPLSVYIADQAITTNKIADASVTSAKILDGTIVNADINASAAIAQSKVANLTSDLALKAPIASPVFTGPATFNGTVSKPSQPAFTAHTGGIKSTVGFITFTNTNLNVGNHYSTSTGRFTAPISGNYLFIFRGLYRSNISTATEVTLYRNGSNISGRGLAYTNPIGSNSHDIVVFQIIINMSVNDWVQPYIHTINSGTDFYLDEQLSSFSGFLIG